MTTDTSTSVAADSDLGRAAARDSGDLAGAQARDRVTLAVLLTASFTLALDFSILNVALPRIGADVGFSLSNLQWISTTFAVCAAGFTLFFGRLADLFGRRRQFLAGMTLLGVAALAGGLAETPWLLLAARVAQGIATAAVIPAALSLLTTSFAEGHLRDRALGLNGALMAAGFTTGAILGGLLTDLVNWRWAFFLNVIVAVAVLAVGPLVLKETRSEVRPRLDAPGAITVTLALVTGVYGLTQAGEHSWSDPRCWGFMTMAAVLLAAFTVIERTVAQPLVPLSILRRRSVTWGNLAGILAFATETSVVFLLTIYLQEVRGHSPLEAGLSFAALGLGTVIGGMVGARVIARIGAKAAIVGGLVVQAAATVPLVFVGEAAGWYAVLLVTTFIGGVANLVAIVGFMVTATSGLPDSEQGLATGLATMSQQVGITLGTPVMSAIATAAGAGLTNGMVHGVTTALTVNAAACLATAAICGLALSGRKATGPAHP